MLHFAPARRMRAAVVAVLALVGAIGVPAAHADGPGVGTLNVVAVGDSYISGPDGRVERDRQDDGDQERDPQRQHGDDARRLLELAVHAARPDLPVAGS